jgi:triacylglycerol lipase
MSFLTKLPIELYNPDAFKEFTGGTDFSIGNARAMAWMSQLAYETDEPDKIENILQLLGLALVEGGVVVRESKTVLPIASTHCFVASHPKAMIVAFAGTDPVSLANWISDFNAHLDDKTGIADGYKAAVDVVLPDLKRLLAGPVSAGKRIFVTGHSLGGALAALTAKRINAELNTVPGDHVDAVYTFGMPRPGDQALADQYNADLGMRTFRLVHGEDIVPTVAPSEFHFRHLGRFLRCERQGKFDKAKLAPDVSSDLPPFDEGAAQAITAQLQGPLSAAVGAVERIKLALALQAGVKIPNARTDPGGIIIELLPLRLRDHMPDRYISACNG